jgi:hypothetical protein
MVEALVMALILNLSTKEAREEMTRLSEGMKRFQEIIRRLRLLHGQG